MLGVLCRIAMEYDREEEGAPTSLVAKFATPVESNRAVAMAYHMYEREVGFYTEVLPQIDAVGPEVLRRRDRADQRRLHRRAGGPVPPDHRRPGGRLRRRDGQADHGRVRPAARQVLGTSRGHDGGDGAAHRRGEPDRSGSPPGARPAGTRAWSCSATSSPTRSRRPRTSSWPSVPEIHKMVGRRVQTIIHGDVRLDNLMFGDDADRPARLGAVGVHRAAGRGLPAQPERPARRAQGPRGRVARALSDPARPTTASSTPPSKILEDYKVGVLYTFCYAIVIGGTLDPANARGAAFMEQMVDAVGGDDDRPRHPQPAPCVARGEGVNRPGGNARVTSSRTSQSHVRRRSAIRQSPSRSVNRSK